ncbi:hypothetical protein [Hoeflea halophila]|uniref:hypothetical protein n=1 Tax=Hoeflea halophila TaxID=714899 RepID=UPI000BE31F5F|nr:hypothetical protein [Hoeflea halophila]
MKSVGRSFQCYFLNGCQWTLPIDAATQVQARRADLSSLLEHWSEVIRKARDGRVIWALRSPHGLMSFYTLAAISAVPVRQAMETSSTSGPALSPLNSYEVVGDTCLNTRLTHETAWLRPRHDGYMQFQDEGSETVADACADG